MSFLHLKRICILTATVAAILSAVPASAEVPNLISYQGRLTDDTGAPVDTVADLTFSIFSDPGGTNMLWAETHADVAIENGLFTVMLGATADFPDDLFDGQTRYLGLQVDFGPMPTDLVAIVSTAYSFRSIHSDTADYAASSDWHLGDGVLYTNEQYGLSRGGTESHVLGSFKSTMVNLGHHSTVGFGGLVDNATIGGGGYHLAQEGASTICGGLADTVTGGGSTIAGGSWSTVAGNNSWIGGSFYSYIGGNYSNILGGSYDTIPAGVHGSYLFGSHSKLTTDSTFMVNVPRIRFGDETTGYEFPSTDGSSGQLLATNGSGQLSWQNVSSTGGGWMDDGSSVRLQNSNDNVGIGVSSPTDRLVVGTTNLGSTIDDQYIVCGNGYHSGYSGYKLGLNSDNYAQMKWYGTGEELTFDTRSLGVNYLNTLVLKQGRVGINNFSPSEPLAIGPDLGSYYGDFVQMGRLGSGRYSGFMCGEDENNRGTMMWVNNTNELRIGYKTGGVDYGADMVLKDGTVGIGANYMGAKLQVESHYDIDLPEVRYGLFNYVVCGGTGDAIGLFSHVHREQVIPFDTLGLTCGVDGVITNIPQGSWTGIGVRGTSMSAHRNYGVQALTYAGDQGVGIYAHADNIHEAWSAILDGPVDMPAPETYSVAYSRIDHPLDPENMYLQHATVESSEMLNVYSGNAVLDDNGEATVRLPEWFDAMNTDFRYQLTCVGGYAPVYIADKVYGNSFRIAGGDPGLEVSWQVTGVRSDPYAEANRLEVELEKSLEDQGLYRHPSAYGKSEAESIYRKHRTTRSETESFQR